VDPGPVKITNVKLAVRMNKKVNLVSDPKAGYWMCGETGYPAGFSVQNLIVCQNLK
jgi:hypothetical protein